MRIVIPKGILIFLWLFITILIWSGIAALLTIADTTLNVLAVVLFLVWATISVETKCLTKFKITKK